jgi:uncharacterized protein DUF4339
MATQWYFEREGRKFGPYLAARLRELATSGELRPQDFVWKEGMEKGVLASRVGNLFAGRGAGVPLAKGAVPASEAAQEPEPAPAKAVAPPAEPAVGEAPAPRDVPPPLPVRKRRVLSVRGGVIQSQDGTVVRYRKTCPKCGHPDSSLTCVPIQCGTTRTHYFCPKCRKNQPVEILAVV